MHGEGDVMKRKSIKLLILVMLTLSSASCSVFQRNEKLDAINLKRYKTGECVDQDYWCMTDKEFKIMLKEASK